MQIEHGTTCANKGKKRKVIWTRNASCATVSCSPPRSSLVFLCETSFYCSPSTRRYPFLFFTYPNQFKPRKNRIHTLNIFFFSREKTTFCTLTIVKLNGLFFISLGAASSDNTLVTIQRFVLLPCKGALQICFGHVFPNLADNRPLSTVLYICLSYILLTFHCPQVVV